MAELDAKTIQKYSKYSVAKLKLLAQKYFNRFIRERDKGEQCISCDSYNTSQASHFYSAGHYNSLRFNEDNVHLSCLRCNYFLAGNLIEYRKKLEKKIGSERLLALDKLAANKRAFKYGKFELILLIEKYK